MHTYQGRDEGKNPKYSAPKMSDAYLVIWVIWISGCQTEAYFD